MGNTEPAQFDNEKSYKKKEEEGTAYVGEDLSNPKMKVMLKAM